MNMSRGEERGHTVTVMRRGRVRSTDNLNGVYWRIELRSPLYQQRVTVHGDKLGGCPGNRTSTDQADQARRYIDKRLDS